MKHLLSYHTALQRIVLIGLMMATAIAVSAQERRVTPVRPETNTVRTPDKNLDPKYIEQYLTGDSLKAQAEARPQGEFLLSKTQFFTGSPDPNSDGAIIQFVLHSTCGTGCSPSWSWVWDGPNPSPTI